jgi:ATP-binding cassette subfamily B protein
MKELLSLYPYIKQYRKYYILGFFFVLLTNASLFIPRLMNLAIENLGGDAPALSFLALCGAGILGLAIFSGTFTFALRKTIGTAGRHVEFDLRNDLFARLSRLSFSYYNRMHTGDIMSRMTSDVEALRMVCIPGIMLPARTLTTLVGATILLLHLNAFMTLILLGPLAAMTIIMVFIGPVIHRVSRSVMDQLGVLSTRAQENFSGIRVVKAFAREESEAEVFDKLAREYMACNMKLVKLRGMLWPLLMTIAMLTVLLTLYLGGRAIIMNRMTLGGFFEFIGLLSMLIWHMIAIGWVITIWQRGSASMARINEILRVVPEIRDSENAKDVSTIEGAIEFRSLTFSYNEKGEQPVLEDITLTIPRGVTYAIVGPVGSGKSTLVNLIPHLFSVSEGALFIDGSDINHIPLAVLRSRIGYVPQDPLLFSDTLSANIAFGKPDASTGEIEAAARAACVYDEIAEFPGGFDAEIGERGLTLSGGQKQRVAIARALIIDPPVLILDDALSSVDTQTEDVLLTNLREFSRKRTTIIISHRISTVKDADRIIVLDNGRITEQGTHSELIKRGGLYTEMYEKQLLEAELE